MTKTAIARYITSTFTGVDVVCPKAGEGPALAEGDTFFIYDPQRNLDANQRFPFATIVTKDYGDFDCASNLNRPGVFRLNIGVSRETFRSQFGAGDETMSGHDFTALDKIMPHPVYGKMFWVCVLNPGEATFRMVQPLLAEAYTLAVNRLTKRETSAGQ